MKLFARNHSQDEEYKVLKKSALDKLRPISTNATLNDENKTSQNKKIHSAKLSAFLDKINRDSPLELIVPILREAEQDKTSTCYTIALANALKNHPDKLNQILISFPRQNKPILPDGFYSGCIGLVVISSILLAITLPLILATKPTLGLFLAVFWGGAALCMILGFMSICHQIKIASYEENIRIETKELLNEPTKEVDTGLKQNSKNQTEIDEKILQFN